MPRLHVNDRSLGKLFAALLLLVLGGAPQASAQPDRSAGEPSTERARLDYRATGPCAWREAFVAQVAARTPAVQWVDDSDAERSFDVRVHAELGPDGRWWVATGLLTIRGPDQAESSRKVEGDNCEDVVSALALITALAIDPSARTGPLVGHEVGGVDRATSGGGGAASGHPLGAPHEAETVAAGSEPALVRPFGLAPTPQGEAGSSFSPDRERLRPPSDEPADRWRWAVGLGATAASGLGSGLGFVLPLYVDVALDRGELLAPSVRLALSYMPTRSVAVAAGTADFYRLAVHPSACPIRLGPVSAVALLPCVGVELGLLHGTGNLAPERSESALWLALDVPFRLQWVPSDWLSLELQVELGVPLVRPRFYFEPDRTIMETQALFGTVGGGAAFRFP